MVKKICIICGREYTCYNKPNQHHSWRTHVKRAFNSLTCSPKCSAKHNEDAKKYNAKKYYQNSLRKKGVLLPEIITASLVTK